MEIKPWAHQVEAALRADLLPHYALFFQMGTGKSKTAIDILRKKFNDRQRLLRTLIFCPPIVVPNWKDEWCKHSKIDPAKVTLLRGRGDERLKKFKKIAVIDRDVSSYPPGHVFVTNYESLLMEDLFQAFLEWEPEALVYDESHELKNPKAKRSKLAEKLSNPYDKTRKRFRTQPLKYILSGTPVLNSPMDLYQQFLILDNGRTFGQNFFVFRARYFRDKNAGMPKARYFPDWQLMPGALEQINRLILLVSMRVTKEECLDLPELVRQTIKVGMTPDQSRMYREMERDFITYMDGSAVVATLALTKGLRLMQIASGFAKTDQGEVKEIANTPKMEALHDLLSELAPHHKVLVWAVWRENYEQIRQVCRSLNLEFVEYHGEASNADKSVAVSRLQNDERVRVYIGHPGSGGVGINLTAASYSIYYSRTFSLKESEQSESRNHRGGAEHHPKITRIDLVCENTIDELVKEKLANKLEISDTVLRDISLQIRNQETE